MTSLAMTSHRWLKTQSALIGCRGKGGGHLNYNGGSGWRGRRGDGLPGRGQVQQRADGSGHLGEPSLLQDVKRKTQLSLRGQTPQKKSAAKGEGGGGQKKGAGTTERWVNRWQIK